MKTVAKQHDGSADRALKQFFTEHDLVISVPIWGMHFIDQEKDRQSVQFTQSTQYSQSPSQQLWQQPFTQSQSPLTESQSEQWDTTWVNHAIRYRTHEKLYCWLSVHSYKQFWSSKRWQTTHGSILNYSQWSLKKSIITLLSTPSNCKISYFYTGDFFIPQEYFLICKEVIVTISNNKQLNFIDKAITFSTSDIHRFIRNITLEQKILPLYFSTFFSTQRMITTRSNDETTTFDEVDRPANIRHSITHYSPSEFFKKSTSPEGQEAILRFIQYLKNTPPDQQSNDTLYTLLKTIRSNLYMLRDRWWEEITQLFTKEAEINATLQTNNYLVLIPTKRYLHRYCIKDHDNASTTLHTDRVIDQHIRGYSLLYDSSGSSNNTDTHNPEQVWHPTEASQWVHCNQRLTKGIRDPRSPESICMRTSKRRLENIPIESVNTSTGILLDWRNNKVSIRWKRFSSKELPSQKAIIEIVGILIKNYGKDIHNSDLPRSSYATNKNNLVGKILGPFTKAINQHLDKKLTIITQWWLYEYTLRLPKQHLPITLIDTVV